ncbi:GDSL-type esterase/lipase family protein [Butyrivibrio sp. VCD2006]|uniref:GDSL-type esterase/lipase family protein n=1 Tax=Butyrivibrio sp. VCD2006 TaxID=1280664 RepID=UPI000415D66F|nr:GDSL-type esterase/lipase family protein [Butyrivibrio sp. VCD2006]
MLKEYKPSEIEFLKVHGRTTAKKDPLNLYWTGSGIEMNVKAFEVRIRYHADYVAFEPWIDVVIGGVRFQKLPLEKGTHEISIWRGSMFTPAKDVPVRNIKIIRDTPAMPGDPNTLVQIEAIITDGTFEKVEEPKLRIEFIGDSITSGEGGMGPVTEQDWVSGIFDAVNNYGYLTAEALGADYESFSQSGFGYMWNWYGNQNDSLPKYYDQICGLLPKGKAADTGALEPYNFSDFVPDFVVINLGTNDVGAYSENGHESAKAMKFENKHVLDENGAIPSEDVEVLRKGAIDFITHIREKRPNAKILWVYGMLLQNSEVLDKQMPEILSGAVDDYVKASGDENVWYFQLPVTLEGEFGAKFHPGLPAHKKAAEALAEKITELRNL